MSNHNINAREHLLDQVKADKIDLLVQVGFPYVLKIKAGDRVCLRKRSRKVWASVIAVRTYHSFEEMLGHEAFKRIAPEMVGEGQLLMALTDFYAYHQEVRGVVVFEIKKEGSHESKDCPAG
jgi:ASC-1-like (ASCH) protein